MIKDPHCLRCKSEGKFYSIGRIEKTGKVVWAKCVPKCFCDTCIVQVRKDHPNFFYQLSKNQL